jgi:acyl-CoA reductase-like NAD-dependent aldehyde dehydrogenase
MKSINPHHPSEVVLEFEPAGRNGVDKAVRAAKSGLEQWSRAPAAERGTALTSIARGIEVRSDELVDLMATEVGKPVSEGRAEVGRAIAIFRYYAQIVLAADGETYPSQDGSAWLISRRYPVGVCGLITPWNFPAAIPAWKTAPALAYGNTVVLKPAPESTATTTMLCEIATGHLPDGVLLVAPGDAETGEALVDHPDVPAISFTGSVQVGHAVAGRAAGRGARVQCEMGGQNPSIVLADADLDAAAKTIAYAAMGYAGQKCTATGRVLVEAPVYDSFKDSLVSAVEELEVFDPFKESCLVGPMIRLESRDDALGALQRGGGNVLTGGRTPDAEGFYLEPTLVEVTDRSSVLAKEEVFAPVTAVVEVRDADDAVAVANDVKYGLSAALFTSDIHRATALLPRIEAGLVRTNAPTTGVEFWAPFGGTKASSIGPREQGFAARDFYTESRTMLIS